LWQKNYFKKFATEFSEKNLSGFNDPKINGSRASPNLSRCRTAELIIDIPRQTAGNCLRVFPKQKGNPLQIALFLFR